MLPFISLNSLSFVSSNTWLVYLEIYGAWLSHSLRNLVFYISSTGCILHRFKMNYECCRNGSCIILELRYNATYFYCITLEIRYKANYLYCITLEIRYKANYLYCITLKIRYKANYLYCITLELRCNAKYFYTSYY